jgi:hypothetical protein
MNSEARHAGPWYQHFWPWFIVLLLGSTVVAGISTVFIAVRGADSLVADDYYREGKAINRTLAADREAAIREAHARVRSSDPATVTLEIVGDLPPSLALELSHVTRSERDLRVELEHLGEGNYRASGALPDGVFYLTLRPSGDASSWRLRRRVELPSQESFELEPGA